MKLLNERNGFSKLLKMCLAAALCVGILPALPSIAFAGEKLATSANSETSTLTYKTADGTFTNEDGETVDAPTGFTSDATDHSKVTLQNFNFTSTAAVGIQFDADITMTLVGANTLTVNSTKSGTNGAGFLFMSKDGDMMTYHSFVLKGTNQASDSLTINYTNNQANTYNMGGFICTKFSQTSCTLTSNTTTSSTSDGVSAYGIWAQNGIESITSSTLNCTCKNTGESTTESPYHAGTAVRNGCGGQPLSKGTAVDSSTINATCYISQTNVQAICTSNDMTFTNSTVKATLQKGSTSAREVYGIACPQDNAVALTNTNSTIDVQVDGFTTTKACPVYGIYFENGYTQNGANASVNINIGAISNTATGSDDVDVVGFDVPLRTNTKKGPYTADLLGGKFTSNIVSAVGKRTSAIAAIADVLNVENCQVTVTAGTATWTSAALKSAVLNMKSGAINAKSSASEGSITLDMGYENSSNGVVNVSGGTVIAESGTGTGSYGLNVGEYTQTAGTVVLKGGSSVGENYCGESAGMHNAGGSLVMSGGYLDCRGGDSLVSSAGIEVEDQETYTTHNFKYSGGLIYAAGGDSILSQGYFSTTNNCALVCVEPCALTGSAALNSDVMAATGELEFKEVPLESNSSSYYAYFIKGTESVAATTVAHGDAYAVEITESAGGSVTSKYSEYYEGLPVELVVAPADGYKLDSLSVTQVLEGTQVALAGATFTMPAADVAVAASFSLINKDNGSGGSGGTSETALSPASETAQTSDGTTIAFLLALAGLVSAATFILARKRNN